MTMAVPEIEYVDVVARGNVLNLQVGQRARLRVDTPELADLIRLDMVRLLTDGEEVLPPRLNNGGCGCGS